VIHEHEKAEPLLGAGLTRRRFCEITGHTPGLSTLHRWRLKGRLRAVMIGGRIFTTESAIREMLAADAARDRGTVNARGTAAAARIERLAATMPRRKGGRR
jgi:predicted site-specific integrase-resolvase